MKAEGKIRSASAFTLLPSAFGSLPLHLVQRVLSEPGALLLDFDLLHAAGDLDLGAVVQVTGFGALKPDHFAAFFRHFTPRNTVLSAEQGIPTQHSARLIQHVVA